MTEEQMYNMSDEELEAEFRKAKESITNNNNIADDTTDNIETVSEESEELEQPEEDSDNHNISADDEVNEDESEDSNIKNNESDEYNKSEEEEEKEKPEDNSEVTETKAQSVQKYKFKANGREYEFTEEEIKEKFPIVFGQAMNYTKKMQAIKPWRKTIDAIQEAKLKHEDINLMIDVLKGDKGAIKEVLKRTGIDALELDTEESNYIAKDYGRDEKTLAIKEVIDEISSDKEYEITYRVLAKEWDESSWKVMADNPTMIKALHIDIKNGMFDKLMPTVEKLKLYDGGTKSDLDYYAMASRMYFDELRQNEEREAIANQEKIKAASIAEIKAKQAKVNDIKNNASKRKAATPVRKAAGSKANIDYLDDSDEAFEEWYKKLEENY